MLKVLTGMTKASLTAVALAGVCRPQRGSSIAAGGDMWHDAKRGRRRPAAATQGDDPGAIAYRRPAAAIRATTPGRSGDQLNRSTVVGHRVGSTQLVAADGRRLRRSRRSARRRLRLIDMTTSLTAVDRRGVLLGSVAGTVSTVNGPFVPIGGDRYGVGT